MSQEDEEARSEANTGGAMVGHIERYKQYISDLKRGGSSGISAAFGRASDLLPPEVMQIKPPAPSAAAVDADGNNGYQLDERVFAENYDAKALRETVESLITACAPDLTSPVGDLLNTPFGELTVDEVFIEGERRMFLLSDMRVIDEGRYQRWRVEPAVDESNATTSRGDSKPDATHDGARSLLGGIRRAPDLTVTTSNGSFLWNIYFDGYDAERVDMFDGSTIAKAEGRDELILALNCFADGFKLYMLSGIMIDPTSGNIFIESNEGAYTAGFLNNGWRIHQYRTSDRGEIYFVTEPIIAGHQPLTIEVTNLVLDMESGTVSYETADNAATVMLRSRKL